MFLYIFFVFVIQICYCSACDCPDFVKLPHYAIYLIGIVIATLLFTTVALIIMLYRTKRVRDSDHTIFGKPRVSVNKYERQLSENSQRFMLRNSGNNDDTVQLSQNENLCDNESLDKDENVAKEVTEETQPNVTETPKVRRQMKVPLFPQMAEKQIDAICKAVLSRPRLKEATSLSDLDRIVNDAKEEEKNKIADMSASTPDLDIVEVLPSPKSTKKFPVYEPNSKESKLRDEMKATFNQDGFKAKLKQVEKSQENKDEIDFVDEVKSKVDIEEYKTVVDKNQEKKTLTKSKPFEIFSKLVNDEMKAKFNQSELKARTGQAENNSNGNRLSVNITKHANKETVQDEIYDSPPRKLNEPNDFPSSPHDEIYDFPPSPKHSSETYVFPPLPKLPTDLNHFPKQSNDLYDFPPSSKPSSDDLYDFPPSPQPLNEIYECPPSSPRTLMVNDEDATGYQFPLSGSDVLFNEPQYTNAKTVPDSEKE